MMFRLIQHLLPRALAWGTTTPKRLRAYLEGLSGLPTDIVTFIDLVYLDLFPSTTRELAAWERQFNLNPGGSIADRRSKLAAAWALQGRQSPDYIQRAIHAAGFTSVFVHEWWESGPPYVARDPRPHVRQPLKGLYQCENLSPWQCFDSGPGDRLAAHCDDTLTNDPGYVVNLDLTRRGPPPVPDDPDSWRFFLYFAGAEFPELAAVPDSRLAELKELVLTMKPAQQWLVFLTAPVEEAEGFGASEFGAAPFGA